MRKPEIVGPGVPGVGVGVGVGLDVGVGVGVGVGLGFEPHGVNGETNVRGFGSKRAKSLKLLSESVQPPLIRVNDLFDGGTGAGVPSEHVVAPYPTRSATALADGQPLGTPCPGANSVSVPLVLPSPMLVIGNSPGVG